MTLLLQHLLSFLIHLFSTPFFIIWISFYSSSIPVATSTLVEVDLSLYAFLSRFVTVTVMLKRQRHSGCFFSYLTDIPEYSEYFTGYEPWFFICFCFKLHRILTFCKFLHCESICYLSINSILGSQDLFSLREWLRE